MTNQRIGRSSATALAGIGVAYVVAIAAGMSRHGLREPIVDPVLAVMEVLTLLSAPVIVALFAALHARAEPSRRALGIIGVAFAALLAGATSGVHFVELTAARQLGAGGIAWPSRAYAVELLAWDVFLGLALLAGAGTLGSHPAERAARRAMLLGGALCLAGIAGPATGDMRLQFVGVFGYAIVLPVAALLLRRVFAVAEAHAAEDPLRRRAGGAGRQ